MSPLLKPFLVVSDVLVIIGTLLIWYVATSNTGNRIGLVVAVILTIITIILLILTVDMWRSATRVDKLEEELKRLRRK